MSRLPALALMLLVFIDAEQALAQYDDHIRRAAALYELPEPLIRAVIRVESNYNPRCRSHVGAMGLMQLMPGTARGMGVTRPYDPYQNIMGGSRFLRSLVNRYRGNTEHALAAYNAGPGRVDLFTRGTRPLPEITVARYVPRVAYYYVRYSRSD